MKYILIPFLLLMTLSAHANTTGMSFQLGALRVVYNEGQKSAPLDLINNSPDTPILTQTIITDDPKGKAVNDFKVIPPLTKVLPGSSNQIKIIQINRNLPADRESLFYINSKALSAANKNNDENSAVGGGINIGIASVIKLFYRPANLPVTVDDAQKNLTFSVTDKKLTITNPSPYYINLINVKVGSENIVISEKPMLAPFEKHSYLLNKMLTDKKIKWTIINDAGGLLEFTR